MRFKFYVILLIVLMTSCTKNNNKVPFFKDYKSNNPFFRLYPDSVISTSKSIQFVKFELTFLDGWKTITGYLAVINDSLKYINTEGEIFLLSVVGTKSTTSSNGRFSYYITEKNGIRTNYYSDNLQIDNLMCLVNNKDTIYRTLIRGFNLMRKDDNLMLYVSKIRGIVGAAAFLEDSIIFYHQGEIYSDTNLTLTKKRLILQ